MADNTQQASAWPEPPQYFRHYTTENLQLLARAKKEGSANVTPDLEVTMLEPPEPVKEGSYKMFNQEWPVHNTLPTLEEKGIQQLFPDGPFDRVAELKKLNRSLVLNYVALLDVLIKSPQDYAKKIDHINIILINMHHILNEYRPHQARETLRIMMENQLEQKRKATEEVKRHCEQVSKILQNLRAEMPGETVGEDIEMDNTDPTELNEAVLAKALVPPSEVTSTRLLNIVDEIV